MNLLSLRRIIHKAIKGTEFETCTYFAGGCVRDYLLQKNIADVDLTVELPEGGIKLAKYLFEKGIVSQPIIYKQFGTALVTLKTIPNSKIIREQSIKMELVMTRKESYRHRSRKPFVDFGSLREDVMRRDFTVNSLLMRVSDGEILDLSQKGFSDLKGRLIRATNDPAIIFKEDPLRLLRAIRFATTLDFEIEAETLNFIRHNAWTIQYISGERIAEELHKIIASHYFMRGLSLLELTGLASCLCLNIPQGNHAGFTRVKPAWIWRSLYLRYFYLLLAGSDSQKLFSCLMLSKNDQAIVLSLQEAWQILMQIVEENETLDDLKWKAFIYHHQELKKEIQLLIYLAKYIFNDNKVKREIISKLYNMTKKLFSYYEINRFHLTGKDLIKAFYLDSSPIIGRLLLEAEQIWLQQPQLDKQMLIEELQEKHPELIRDRKLNE